MQDFKKINKKTLGKNILFFLVFALILLWVSHTFNSISLKNEKIVQGRNKSLYRIQKEEKDTIEVLVLGDSLSYSSISPVLLWNEYGMTTYICGQPGQKIQETYYLMKKALETQKPKVIVLETNAMFRGKDGVDSVRDSIEQWGNYNMTLFRTHNLWKSFLMNVHYSDENFKGYVVKSEIRPYKRGSYMHKTKRKYKLPDTTRAYMKKIQNLCQENDMKLLLVSVPSPKNYTYRKYNALKYYAKENHLDYLDMNLPKHAIGMNWKTDTCDAGDHLNYLGAEKVTQKLGEYLNQNYDLADYRMDPNYKSWYTLSQEYDKKIEQLLTQRK